MQLVSKMRVILWSILFQTLQPATHRGLKILTNIISYYALQFYSEIPFMGDHENSLNICDSEYINLLVPSCQDLLYQLHTRFALEI